MAVKVVEVSRVTPAQSSPGSSAPKSLTITFFDVFWLNFPPTQRLLFYSIPHHLISSFPHSILPKLKASLSLTLHHFLPIAGTLVWPPESDEPYIRVDDAAAVSLTVAESDADFHRLSGCGLRGSAESHPLIPHLPASETEASIVALQITVFPNCGFCIALASNHTVLDGKTSTMFLKSWASACRLGEWSAELVPFYDRTVIRDPKGIKAVLLNERQRRKGAETKSLMVHEMEPPQGAIRGTFVLTRAHIEKLRERCCRRQKQEHMVPTRISTFALATAYAWVCLIKTQGAEKKTIYIGIAANGRSRLSPPIPETYFGNCVTGGFAIITASDMESEDGVSVAAEAISETIRKIKEEGVPEEPEELISMCSVYGREKVVSLAGSPQFGLYGADFGWGGPRKTEVASIDRTGAIELSDSRDSGGVEVGVVLHEAEMETFVSLFSDGLLRP